MARRTFSGVKGVERRRAPVASQMALQMAGESVEMDT